MNPNDVNVPTPDEMTPEVMVSLINQLSELNDCALSDPMGDDAGQVEVGIYLQGRGRAIAGKIPNAHVSASIEYRMWFESFSDLLVHVMGEGARFRLASENGWFTSTTVVESFGIGIPEPEDDGVTDEMVDAAYAHSYSHFPEPMNDEEERLRRKTLRSTVAAAMAVQKNTP